MKYIKKDNLVILIFFILYLSLGINIVKNYSVSFDEESNRLYGLVNGNYILKTFLSEEKYNSIFNNIINENFSEKIKIKQPTPLYEFADRAYGVVFELPITAIEILLNFKNTHDIYVFRHLATFLFFFISLIIFYLFLKKIFKNKFIALTGVIILISNPRIFADSFYNSKDIVFLSFFLITFYFAYSFILKNKTKNLILLSFFSACSINLRAIAVIIPFMVYMDIIHQIIKTKKFKIEIIYLPLISLLFLYIIWPFLWESPINNLIYVINWFKEIPINIENFYLGDDHNALSPPWHYLFVWILNTTPAYILILMFLGIILFIFGNKKYLKLYLIFFYSLVIPFCLVIFLNIALYDGWRHFYFIAPFLTIFCLISIDAFFYYKFYNYIKIGLSVLILTLFLKNIYDLKKLHPYENLYFNYLFVSKPYEIFDKDYWGLTNRIVLENFYKVVDDKEIIYGDMSTIIFKTSDFLSKFDKRNFIHYKNVGNIDEGPFYYFVLNRYHPPYENIKKNSKIIYEFKLDNQIINGVYKFDTIRKFLEME